MTKTVTEAVKEAMDVSAPKQEQMLQLTPQVLIAAAVEYLTAREVGKDTHSRQSIETRAYHNDPDANVNLGMMYLAAWGIPENCIKAHGFLLTGAVYGHYAALAVLAGMNLLGYGADRNLPRAYLYALITTKWLLEPVYTQIKDFVRSYIVAAVERGELTPERVRAIEHQAQVWRPKPGFSELLEGGKPH